MQLGSSKLVNEKSSVVVSHSSRLPLEDSYNVLSLVKRKRYGDTCISIFSKEGET